MTVLFLSYFLLVQYGGPGRLMGPESKEQPLSDAANPSAAALGER